MGELPSSVRSVRFGVFEVDLRAGELRKKGIRIKLQGQPFLLLITLLKQRGELVTREELRRSVFFLLLQGTIVVVALVVPGGQVVAAPALVLVTMLFLPLSYAAYTLDRRAVPFATRRRWVVEQAPRMLGYGGTAFLAFLIPGVNFLFLPVLEPEHTLGQDPPAPPILGGEAGRSDSAGAASPRRPARLTSLEEVQRVGGYPRQRHIARDIAGSDIDGNRHRRLQAVVG